MLARVNRIARAADFKSVVRSGRRFSTAHSVVYVARTAGTDASRFGFIVSKTVGNSVARHRVTRRLRAIGFELVPLIAPTDIVVRALPGCDEVHWATLQSEIVGAIERSGTPIMQGSEAQA